MTSTEFMAAASSISGFIVAQGQRPGRSAGGLPPWAMRFSQSGETPAASQAARRSAAVGSADVSIMPSRSAPHGRIRASE
jgi:hypothetical protein